MTSFMFPSSTLSKPPRWHLVYLHHLRPSMSKITKNTSKSKISWTRSASIAVSIISSNGKVSPTRRTHGNPSSIFLHVGSSRNFIVAILENPESLVILFLLLFCWINCYGSRLVVCLLVSCTVKMQQHHHFHCL